ncbi:MAG: hypothetical protein PHV34_10945 [Verrucomicrobiae bacterium]|nr:hypothetical protein [Verrucomicrobiae bacterium]
MIRDSRFKIQDFAWLLALLILAPFLFAQDTPSSPSAPAGVSLLANGDFAIPDTADPGKPAHWDKPDGLGVQWIEVPATPGQPARGKAICLNTAISEQAMVQQWAKMGITQWVIPKPAINSISDTYGLSFYSDAMPVKAGQSYRVTFDFMSAGPKGKLWVRGYGLNGAEHRRLYETIVFCDPTKGAWQTFSQLFTPTKFRPNVTEMKVMLYAYHPPGVCWYDNIRIEEASPK